MGNAYTDTVYSYTVGSVGSLASLAVGTGPEADEEDVSNGIGLVRDDKYANLGNPVTRRTALLSISLQTFLSEAACTMENGGPREDQCVSFNCYAASKYPLHFAAITGDVRKLRYLVHECGVDPNEKFVENMDVQAIAFAARYGHLLAVVELLKWGADPFEIYQSGQNALSESYKEGHLHVTYFLREVARRFKAYFAAKRLATQLNFTCCDHCIDRYTCRECVWSDNAVTDGDQESCSGSGSSVSGSGSVVTEHLAGATREHLNDADNTHHQVGYAGASTGGGGGDLRDNMQSPTKLARVRSDGVKGDHKRLFGQHPPIHSNMTK